MRIGALAGGMLVALSAAAAQADSIESATGFDVLVTGRIVADCRLSGGGVIDFGELTGNEVVTADLGLRCNVPFDLSFESASGGLAHVGKPPGEGPFGLSPGPSATP